MFAYSLNNPINYIDEEGYFVNTIVGGLVGGLWGGISAGKENFWTGFRAGFITGSISGAGVDIAIGLVLNPITSGVIVAGYGFLGGVIGNSYYQAKTTGQVNIFKAVYFGAKGAFYNVSAYQLSVACNTVLKDPGIGVDVLATTTYANFMSSASMVYDIVLDSFVEDYFSSNATIKDASKEDIPRALYSVLVQVPINMSMRMASK